MERKYWQGKRIRIERKPVPAPFFFSFFFFSYTKFLYTYIAGALAESCSMREKERERGKKSIEGEKIGNKSWEKRRREETRRWRGSYVIHAREGTGSSSSSLSLSFFFRVNLSSFYLGTILVLCLSRFSSSLLDRYGGQIELHLRAVKL